MDWFKIGKGVHLSCILSPFLTSMQSTSCKMPGWMKHKLKSRLLGKIPKISDMQCESESVSCSVLSDSLQPHGLKCTRLPCSSPSPRLAQTHAHWVSDAIQPYRTLLLPSIFPSIRVFSNEPALPIRWPQYWSFSFTICHKGGIICISGVLGLSPGNLDSDLCFIQPGILHDVLCVYVKAGWQYIALRYSFPNFESVHCFMSGSNCCFLTCIQISQEAGQVVWYCHLF